MLPYKSGTNKLSSNARFLYYESAANESHKEIFPSQRDGNFNHELFQKNILKGSYDEKCNAIENFIRFYSNCIFEINDISFPSIPVIVDIIKQRDPNSRELVQYCFKALTCLFHPEIDSTIFFQTQIPTILYPYLEIPDQNDILQTLTIIKYLLYFFI